MSNHHSGRSHTGVDDIDGDDTPTTVQTNHADAPAAAAAASGRSTTGVDDIDGDDEPAAAPPQSRSDATNAAATGAAAAAASSSTAAASSRPAAAASSSPTATAASGSSSVPLTAAGEVDRILGVISADEALAAAAAAAAGPASDPGAVAPARAAAVAQPNHFGVLGLPPPQVNAAGEGVWLVDDEDLKRAFKRLVLQIHPDKNPHPGAKHAFEAVKTAHRVLSSSSSRYDYVRAYVAFTEAIAMRNADFCPRGSGVGSGGSLEESLAQGRALQDLRAKQVSSFAAKLQAQAEAKLAAARAGEAARARRDDIRRQEDLKRRIVHSDSDDSDSDEGRHLSVAEKIRLAKGKQKKKIRAL